MGGGESFGGETNLGGVPGLVVGRVQVEVSDVPEPAWKRVRIIKVETKKRSKKSKTEAERNQSVAIRNKEQKTS